MEPCVSHAAHESLLLIQEGLKTLHGCRACFSFWGSIYVGDKGKGSSVGLRFEKKEKKVCCSHAKRVYGVIILTQFNNKRDMVTGLIR